MLLLFFQSHNDFTLTWNNNNNLDFVQPGNLFYVFLSLYGYIFFSSQENFILFSSSTIRNDNDESYLGFAFVFFFCLFGFFLVFWVSFQGRRRRRRSFFSNNYLQMINRLIKMALFFILRVDNNNNYKWKKIIRFIEIHENLCLGLSWGPQAVLLKLFWKWKKVNDKSKKVY